MDHGLPDAPFDGDDYQPARDHGRLRGQALDIYKLMHDGTWRTLGEIAERTGHPEASISAQLRHLRKARFGNHTVNREYVADGLYRYQLIVNQKT